MMYLFYGGGSYYCSCLLMQLPALLLAKKESAIFEPLSE